jgi:DNA-binding response OmpR family regulator
VMETVMIAKAMIAAETTVIAMVMIAAETTVIAMAMVAVETAVAVAVAMEMKAVIAAAKTAATANPDQRPRQSQSIGAATALYNRLMRVLLAEDDNRIAAFIVKGLREEGHVVEHVSDGEAALDYVAASTDAPFDVIILDVLMPRRDGNAVCRELRTRRVSTPVLMLTAMDALEDRVRGLDSGADDYLVKPFAFPELLARLRALGRRTSTVTPSTQLQLADLTLDTQTRVARRNGRTIELSAREFQLLEYLLRHAGRAISRTQLLQAVWSFDYSGASNVVDVYMGYLRRKIDGEGEVPLVHTVRSVGYMIGPR